MYGTKQRIRIEKNCLINQILAITFKDSNQRIKLEFIPLCIKCQVMTDK